MDKITKLRNDALHIATQAIKSMHPVILLKQHLKNWNPPGKIFILAIGKAAWQMAKVAYDHYENNVSNGFVITKYDHSEGKIGNLKILEAGHPFPDENSITATHEALQMLSNLDAKDNVLFLISGGGSAVFEKPLSGIELTDIISITKDLMNAGADISELNCVRKHLSAVKGGRLLQYINAKSVKCYILSDVVGDNPESIASGLVFPDKSTSDDAFTILQKYKVEVSQIIKDAISLETPKKLNRVEYQIIGNCSSLAEKAKILSLEQNFTPSIIHNKFQGNVESAIELMVDNYLFIKKLEKISFSLIITGEAILKVTGKGKGGRNQHLSLIASQKISGLDDVVILALASDGTDGPTDAAGGIVDGTSWQRIIEAGINPDESLLEFDSYNALKESGDLVIIGPSGTNVNDLIMLLSK